MCSSLLGNFTQQEECSSERGLEFSSLLLLLTYSTQSASPEVISDLWYKTKSFAKEDIHLVFIGSCILRQSQDYNALHCTSAWCHIRLQCSHMRLSHVAEAITRSLEPSWRCNKQRGRLEGLVAKTFAWFPAWVARTMMTSHSFSRTMVKCIWKRLVSCPDWISHEISHSNEAGNDLQDFPNLNCDVAFSTSSAASSYLFPNIPQDPSFFSAFSMNTLPLAV